MTRVESWLMIPQYSFGDTKCLTLKLTVIGSIAPRKGPRRFCPHRSDRCWCLRTETHPCGNVVSAVIMSCLCLTPMARSIEQRGHHVRCALIGTSRKLAAYNYTSTLALWMALEYELVHTNGSIQKVRVEPATRSAVATRYTPGRGKILPRNLI